MKRAAALLSAMLLASACSILGGDEETDAAGGGGLVTTALEDLPQISTDDQYEIRVVDVGRIAELAGLNREEADLRAIFNPSPRSEGGIGFWPVVPGILRDAIDDDALRAEAGFGFADIETVSEMSAPPEQTSVFTGPDGWGGAVLPHEGDVRTIGVGDDLEQVMGQRSSLDSLGRAMRVGEAEGRLVASLSTPAVQGWLDGSGARYSELPILRDMAVELDRQQVLSARLFMRHNLAAPLPVAFDLSAEEYEEMLAADAERAYISHAFVAAGIGNTVRDGRVIDVAVYHFLDEATAEAAMPSIEIVWTESVFTRSGEPVSGRTEFESIERNGAVVTVVATVPVDQLSAIDNIFYSREPLFAYR